MVSHEGLCDPAPLCPAPKQWGGGQGGGSTPATTTVCDEPAATAVSVAVVSHTGTAAAKVNWVALVLRRPSWPLLLSPTGPGPGAGRLPLTGNSEGGGMQIAYFAFFCIMQRIALFCTICIICKINFLLKVAFLHSLHILPFRLFWGLFLYH